jgi:DNA/RNA endonuclease YhcR with UshA esterase domain
LKPTVFITLGLSASFAAGLAATAAPVTGHKPAPAGEKTYPDQSTVATKTPFATAAAAAAKGALDAKNLAGAEKLVGKPGAFQGTVSAVYSPKNHAVVILDFDREYDQALTAIALPASYAKLPNLATLKGRHVLISGQFKEYKRKTEIEIDSASQIKLLP